MSMDWRAEIEKALRSTLDDAEWNDLVNDRYVSELDDDGSDTTPKDVAEVVRHRRSTYGQGRTYEGRPHSERAPAGWQSKRVGILADAYAQTAEGIGDVRRLRAKLYDADTGLDKSAPVRWIMDRYYLSLGVELGDDAGAQSSLQQMRSVDRELVELWYLAGRQVRTVSVPVESILGEVGLLSAELHEWFGWSHSDATMWLLCGGRPPTPFLFSWRPRIRQAGIHDTCTRLIMEVDPTLNPRDVATYYVQARAQIFPRQRVRPLDEKALALARFYLDRPKDERTRTPWEAWRESWNAGPGKQYKVYEKVGADPDNFRRDVRSAWERLTHVGWKVPD